MCYVHDTAAMGVGAGPVEARNALAAEARRVAEEGKKAGLEFDPEKGRWLQFGKGRELGLRVGGRILRSERETKELGVVVRSDLTFGAHIKRQAAKAARASGFVKRVNNTVRGLQPRVAVAAVSALAVSRVTYGAQIWWRGFEGAGRPKRTGPIKRRKRGAVGMEEVVRGGLLKAARAALPVWKTTPKAVLLRESGLGPVWALLDRLRAKAWLSQASVPEHHPLKAALRLGRFRQRAVFRPPTLLEGPPPADGSSCPSCRNRRGSIRLLACRAAACSAKSHGCWAHI